MSGATVASIAVSSPMPAHPAHPGQLSHTRSVNAQRLTIIATVVLAHMVGLWALHSALLRREAHVERPETIMTQLIEPAQPASMAPAPPSPAAPPTPQAQRRPTPRPPTPVPQPSSTTPPRPATQEPMHTEALSPTPPTQAQVVAAPPAATDILPSLQGHSPRTEPMSPPNQSAGASEQKTAANKAPSHCGNKKPSYPMMSKRFGERGTVLIRAWVESDGSVSKADVLKSSGFERLDQAALTSVRTWRFEPGLQEGVPTGMPVHIPFSFGQTENTTESASQITCQ